MLLMKDTLIKNKNKNEEMFASGAAASTRIYQI